jgi:hypothetical protein
MSAPIQEIKATEKKQWDVATVLVAADNNENWGVAPDQISNAFDLLKNLPTNLPTAGQINAINFKQFRGLIMLLHKQGFDTGNINEAIESYAANRARNNIFESLTELIQAALRSLFSEITDAPYKVLVDGKWGPKSSEVLEFVSTTYNLVDVRRSDELVELLRAIAKRIVRIKCTDEKLLAQASYNPFAILDSNSKELMLLPKVNGAAIIDSTTNKELVQLNNIVTAKVTKHNSFIPFSAWFMLLKMGSLNYRKNSLLSIKTDNEQWIPLEQLPKTHKDEYLVQPDFYLSFSDFSSRVHIAFSSPTNEAIDIIGVYFSGYFKFTITTGYLSEDIGKAGGLVKYFDSEYFFRDYDYLKNKDAEAYPLHKADYLKIFVVKKGFQSNSSENQYRNFAGIEASSDFYKLITANEADIYATYTIGLVFNETAKTVIKPFNNKRILIAGPSGATVTFPKERLFCDAIGKALAANGYGIIYGANLGIDDPVSRSFFDYLGKFGISEKYRNIQLLRKDQNPINDYGILKKMDDDYSYDEEVLSSSFAIMMIGGKGGDGGTLPVFEKAQTLNIPVIPIPSTSIDAETAYRELINKKKFPSSKQLFVKLDKQIDSVADAEEIAQNVIAILDEMKTPPKKILSQDQFKTIVENVYKKEKITVADDLQKNRWGGKAENNGYSLKAAVKTSRIPGNYNIVLNLRSDSSSKAGTRVAFFLHNTFTNEIEYEVVTKGLAQLEISAYEAFTVGAYLEDGTMLELDLNEVTGYPAKFYYTDISELFKEVVKKIYKERKVTVNDDLQKNRWGGRSIVNGKQLKAVVTKALIPGYFNIALELSSENSKKPLAGDVAFFLHDTFSNEIKYRKALEGVAKINVTAYEAFTVAAYTQDGTTLELDLQLQKGYPKEFYYKEEKPRSNQSENL